MKTKQRKRMRGFDVAQFLAFNTFPNIKRLKIYIDSYTVDKTPIIYVEHTETGEVIGTDCRAMEDCSKLAKCVNKMLKQYEEIERNGNL